MLGTTSPTPNFTPNPYYTGFAAFPNTKSSADLFSIFVKRFAAIYFTNYIKLYIFVIYPHNYFKYIPVLFSYLTNSTIILSINTFGNSLYKKVKIYV